MKVIVTGLKFLGNWHIQSMLDAVEHAVNKQDKTSGYQLVVGFDMVNEEDYNAPINTFLEQILTTKARMGERFQVYLHAGESH